MQPKSIQRIDFNSKCGSVSNRLKGVRVYSYVRNRVKESRYL